MPKPYKRKNRMVKFRIGELSSVDVPAQQGARALIMKRDNRAPAPRDVKKDDVVQAVTGENEGHIHGIRIHRYHDGEVSIIVSYAQAEGAESGHDHMLYRDPTSGTYSVLPNAGHTHELDSAALNAAIVASVTKRNPEDAMTPEEKARLEKAEQTAKRLEKVAALSPEHFAHYSKIEKAESQDNFLSLSADERDVIVADMAKRATDTDPVVYTIKHGVAKGTEIRKSAGDLALAMAKNQDEQAEQTAALAQENADLKKAASTASFEKRASEELNHLPGTLQSRAALLKAAESIEDEGQRKEAVAALKANNAAMGPMFKAHGIGGLNPDGSGGPETGGEPQARVDELVKEYQKAHPGTTKEAAEAEIYATAEGAQLYSRIVAAETAEARSINGTAGA